MANERREKKNEEKMSVQLKPVTVFVRTSSNNTFGFYKIVMAKSTIHTSKSQGQMIEMHKTNSHIVTDGFLYDRNDLWNATRNDDLFKMLIFFFYFFNCFWFSVWFRRVDCVMRWFPKIRFNSQFSLKSTRFIARNNGFVSLKWQFKMSGRLDWLVRLLNR